MNDTERLIESIFPQGDTRYNDFYAEEIVASFIKMNGIQIDKRIIKKEKITKKDLQNINGPQRLPKAIATKLLKKEGFDFIGYERKFMGGIADVLAVNKQNNKVVVECYSCRTMKAIDYLEHEDTILWIMSSQDSQEFLNETFSLFILKRGTEWDRCIQEYKKEKIKRFQSVKSPRD